MEIGWWGGGAPGHNEQRDDEQRDIERRDDVRRDDENGGGDAEANQGASVETPAEQPPARPVAGPVKPVESVKAVKSAQPVKPATPLATLPSAPPANPPASAGAAAETSAERDSSLATVSYLPWAAPGIDVAASSGIESTAFRRPFLAPERGFDRAGFDSDGEPVVIAEPGDWTAEYSDEDDEEEAEAEFDPAALENALIKKLARRDLSIAEAEHFLEQNGLPAEQLEEWIERNERLGYLDDLRLAENLVDQLRRRKGLGSSSIRQELSRRKIDPIVISEALGESDQDDERARALELAVKRAGQLSSYDEATAERRLTGFLMRKGYPSGVVRDAVKTALAGRKRPSGGVRFR